MTGQNPGGSSLLHIALGDQREQARAVAQDGDLVSAERAARGLVIESARVAGAHSELTTMAALFHCSILGAGTPDAAATILRDVLVDASLRFGVRSDIATACAGLLASCLPVNGQERQRVMDRHVLWILDETAEDLGPEQRRIAAMLRGGDGPSDG